MMATDNQAAAPPTTRRANDANDANEAHATDDSPDDMPLVWAALRDPAAFAPLYRAHRDRVYWYLLARTGNADDAADLTQQTFLKALDALAQYRPQRGPFVAWLFGIARNAATNHQQRARPTVAWDAARAHLRTSGIPGPEDDALRRESLESLLSLLAALEPAKQELLALRFVAGLTSAQIAVVIGKSEAATKKQLTRILHSLKERYHDADQ